MVYGVLSKEEIQISMTKGRSFLAYGKEKKWRTLISILKTETVNIIPAMKG